MVERQLDVKTGDPGDFWSGVWQPFRQIGQQIAHVFSPSSEAFENEDAYTIQVELPGVTQDNIDVSIRDDRLIIRGEKRDMREEKGESYFFSERSYGEFQRAFRLPPDVDRSKVDAAFDHGVLKIVLPRAAKKEPKEQKIKVGTKT